MTHAVPKAVVHTKIETTVQEAAGDPQHVSIERVQINTTPEVSQRACPWSPYATTLKKVKC